MQDHIQPKPVQRQSQVHVGNRGVCGDQRHASRHLLLRAATEDGGGEAEELIGPSQARRRVALPRRSLHHRLLRRARAEPREPPPRLRRLRQSSSERRQDDMDQGHVPDRARQHGVVALDRAAGQAAQGVPQQDARHGDAVRVQRRAVVRRCHRGREGLLQVAPPARRQLARRPLHRT